MFSFAKRLIRRLLKREGHEWVILESKAEIGFFFRCTKCNAESHTGVMGERYLYKFGHYVDWSLVDLQPMPTCEEMIVRQVIES